MNIIFTRTFLWLLMLGILPLSMSWVSPTLLWIGGLYDLLLFLAAVLDYRSVAPHRHLEVTRRIHHHLSLNSPNEIRIRVTNKSGRPAEIWLKDEHPAGMEASLRDLHLSLEPNRTTETHYNLTPRSRGDFYFGGTVVRHLGPMGLVWRQAAFCTDEEVRVSPNFRQARSIELQAHRHRRILAGQKRHRVRGHGREFESLRDFVTGDELRHVAWTATARRGRLVTRQYQVERNQSLMIMLDTGRMMKAQIGALSKLDHAVNAALSLAYVALTGGDNVGLLIFGRQVTRYVPPRHRPDQLTTLLEALYNVQAELIEPHYARAFEYFTTRHKKRSLVVILTDIFDRDSSSRLIAYTCMLTSHHLPLIVTIGDGDLRSLIQQPPESVSDLYQQAIAREMLNQRREALALITSHGGLALDVPSGDLAVEVVNRYLDVKEQGLL